MKIQKIEEWRSAGGFGGCHELSIYIKQLMNAGKIIVSVIPTRYYGQNQPDIEIALIITEEDKAYVPGECFDMNHVKLNEGDFIEVQNSGICKIYKKEDSDELYFKLYRYESKVSDYFSGDLLWVLPPTTTATPD